MRRVIGHIQKLSVGIPYVRIDTYIVDGHIYFGEMSFFTWSSYMRFEPEEYDKELRDMIKLPAKYTKNEFFKENRGS